MADLSKLQRVLESGVAVAADEDTRVEYHQPHQLRQAKSLLQEDDIRAAARGKPRVRRMQMHPGYF